MPTTAALIDERHATELKRALPGRRRAAIVTRGVDTGVRVTQSEQDGPPGCWEAVAFDATKTWVWWQPNQGLRDPDPDGVFLEVASAPIHYPRHWAEQVASAIGRAASRRGDIPTVEGTAWTNPLFATN